MCATLQLTSGLSVQESWFIFYQTKRGWIQLIQLMFKYTYDNPAICDLILFFHCTESILIKIENGPINNQATRQPL